MLGRGAKNVVYIKMGKKKYEAMHEKMEKESPKSRRMEYSPTMARKGKDIGKKGKMFSKIAKKAGKKYGSVEIGKKVAGKILSNLRKKYA